MRELKKFALALVLIFALAGPLYAWDWDVQYEADDYPDQSDPAWTNDGSGTVSCSGGILYIGWTYDKRRYYHGSTWGSSVDNATGWTVEFKLKVIGASSYTPEFFWYDGTRRGYARWCNTYVYDGVTTYTMDTTDDYHIYRFTGQGNNMKTYVDGVLKLDRGGLLTTSTKQVGFGRLDSGTSTKVAYDYVYYYIGGAEPPAAVGGFMTLQTGYW